MKSLLFLLCLLVVCLSSCYCGDLVVGTIYNSHLTWTQKVDYMAIPFKKRVKNVFYADPAVQVIKGIIATELEKTSALPIITAGGIGSTFVNIRFKSERGSGLHYQIEIYTMPIYMFKTVEKNGTGDWIQDIKTFYALKKLVHDEILDMQEKNYLNTQHAGRITLQFVAPTESQRFDNVVQMHQAHRLMEIALSDNSNYFYVIFILQDLVRKTKKALDSNDTKPPYTLTAMRYAKYVLGYLVHCYLAIKWIKFVDNGITYLDTFNLFIQWLDPTEWRWDEDIMEMINKLGNKVKIILDVKYPTSTTLSVPERISKNIVTEKEVLHILSDVIQNESNIIEKFLGIDTMDIVMSIKLKRTTLITMAVIFYTVASLIGVPMSLFAYASNLCVEWLDTDASRYVVNLKNGELVYLAKRNAQFDPFNNASSCSPKALLEHIVYVHRIQHQKVPIKSWDTYNLVLLCDFLENQFNSPGYKPYKRFYSTLLYNADLLNTDLHITNIHPNYGQVVRHLFNLNAFTTVVRREMIVTPHHGSVKYAIGMICRHKVQDYLAIILSWSLICEDEMNYMIKKNLEYGLNQPFYFIVAEDQSIRYIAQENLVEEKKPERLDYLEDLIAKDFTHYNGFYYVPNKEKRQEYPMDEAVANVYRERYTKKRTQ
ncbi:hypothetical protein ACJJTC_004358 [Scirpophaga incertulas]